MSASWPGCSMAAQHLAMAGAAQVEQVFDQRLVLTCQQLGLLGALVDLGERLGEDAECRAGAGGRAAHAGALQAVKDRHLDSVGQLARILDPRHGTDTGVAPLDPRDRRTRLFSERAALMAAWISSRSSGMVTVMFGSTTPLLSGRSGIRSALVGHWISLMFSPAVTVEPPVLCPNPNLRNRASVSSSVRAAAARRPAPARPPRPPALRPAGS